MNLRKRTRDMFEGANYYKENTNQYDLEFWNEQMKGRTKRF